MLLSQSARADEVDDLVAHGEALAKKSEFTSAIEAFKAADAKRPRAKHACLIGLVYTRRELWPQAELFFALCRKRATADDPLPKWMDEALAQLNAKLTAAGAAPVTIVVKPAEAHARITVSSFAPDEVFEPQTIHLSPGRHTFDVTADSYAPASREVIVTDASPQTVTIELQSTADAAREAAADAAARAPVAQPVAVVRSLPPPPSRSKVPLIVMAGGVALGVAGGLYDVLALKPARDRLASSADDAIYDSRLHLFHFRRDVTVGLYAGTIAALATAVVLRYTVFRGEEAPVAIGASVEQGGAVVTLGWMR